MRKRNKKRKKERKNESKTCRKKSYFFISITFFFSFPCLVIFFLSQNTTRAKENMEIEENLEINEKENEKDLEYLLDQVTYSDAGKINRKRFKLLQQEIPIFSISLASSFDMYKAPSVRESRKNLFYVQHSSTLSTGYNGNGDNDLYESKFLLRKSTRIFLKKIIDFNKTVELATLDLNDWKFQKRLVLKNTFLYDQMFQMLIFEKRKKEEEKKGEKEGDVDDVKKEVELIACLQFLASYQHFFVDNNCWTSFDFFALKSYVSVDSIVRDFYFVSDLYPGKGTACYNPNDLTDYVIYKSN